MNNVGRRLLRGGLQNREAANEQQSLLSQSEQFSPPFDAYDTSSLLNEASPSNDSESTISIDSTVGADKRPIVAKLNSWRLEHCYWIDSWAYAKYWDLFDLILNVAFVFSYIILTWYSIGPRETEKAPPPPPQTFQDMDFVISQILFIQWIPRILFSLFPFQELQTSWSISTLISCLSCLWVFFNLSRLEGTFLEGGNVVFLYPFRFWRIHGSISRCFPVGKKGIFAVSPVKQKAINLGLSIFTTLFLVTAWTHIVLYKVQKYYDLNFLDIFYTIAVSSTSGLSTQIVPDNVFSRIVTFGIMIIGAIFLPTQLSDLITLLRSQSKYSRSFKPQNGRNHVVIVGNLEIVSLRGFLKEFFNSDHGSRTRTTSVIMLSPYEPSADLEALLSDPIYVNRVQYVKGSATSFRHLQKAKVGTAKAAFVLANRVSDSNPVEEDAKTVMRCVALRKFHRKLKIFAQIILPRNKVHLEDLADQVMCIDEFRLGMIAQNCIAPGFTTILYILTNSISDQVIGDLNSHGNSKWIREYLHGATMEVYEVVLDLKYTGMKFSDACLAIYKHHGAVLFALGTNCGIGENGTFNSGQNILFAPWETVLQGGERAYLITNDNSSARKVGRFDFRISDSSFTDNAFLSDERILNHIKSMRKPTNDNTGISAPRPPNLASHEGSLEKIPATIRSLTNKGKFDFQILKQPKQKIGDAATEEEAPLFRNSQLLKLDIGPVNSPYRPGISLPADVENHYLYCILGDLFPSNLIYFVSPLRQKDPDSAIVFLCSTPPEEDDWEILSEFPNVYFIKGSPLLRKDLRKANVQKAARTICLADASYENVSDRISDSTVLLSLLNMQAMCKVGDKYENFVTVEFHHIQNMKLIGNYDHSLKEAAVSDVLELEMQNIIPAFAGGHVFSSHLFHPILAQCYYEHNLIAVLKMFLFDGASCGDNSTSDGSFFFQIELPLDCRFVGLPFGSLFTYLLTKYNCLILGLYRQCEESGRSFQYVMLNPTAEILIEDDDMLFVVGPSKPIWD